MCQLESGLSGNDQLCLISILASVIAALSVTAIWSVCSSHSHLCHVITFSWVVFTISEQWIINTRGCKRRGQGRESQCVSVLTHRKVTNKQIGLTESHSLHMFSIWPPCSATSRFLTSDKDIFDINLCVIWSVYWKDILTGEAAIFTVNRMCLETCVFTAPEKCLLCWGCNRYCSSQCYWNNLIKGLHQCCENTHIHTQTHTHTLSF